MTSPSMLRKLMRQAQADGSKDAEFFHALLDATVYVHIPKFKQLHPWRFMQVNHSGTGVLVVPFFTDQKRARRATQSVAQVEAMNCRAFMDATRGSTLILNPEDTPCCILYPEEIAVLLDEGYMARVQQIKARDTDPTICRLSQIPNDLITLVVPVLRELPYVDIAYVVGRAWKDQPDLTTYLLALGGDPKFAERAARAVTTVLQRQADRFQTVVDLTYFDVRETPPAWIADLEVNPVYRRGADALLRGSVDNVSKN